MTGSISGKVSEIRRDSIFLKIGAVTLNLKVKKNLLVDLSIGVGDTVDILGTDDYGVVQNMRVLSGAQKASPSPGIIGRIKTQFRTTEGA